MICNRLVQQHIYRDQQKRKKQAFTKALAILKTEFELNSFLRLLPHQGLIICFLSGRKPTLDTDPKLTTTMDKGHQAGSDAIGSRGLRQIFMGLS